MNLWWTPRFTMLPWVVAATLLAALSCWDLVARAGQIDFVLLGLAGYELVIGLTEQPLRDPQRA